MTSDEAAARALYSTSNEDFETVDCFFDFQLTKQNPVRCIFFIYLSPLFGSIMLGFDTTMLVFI